MCRVKLGHRQAFNRIIRRPYRAEGLCLSGLRRRPAHDNAGFRSALVKFRANDYFEPVRKRMRFSIFLEDMRGPAPNRTGENRVFAI